jgi:hypothetical protein
MTIATLFIRTLLSSVFFAAEKQKRTVAFRDENEAAQTVDKTISHPVPLWCSTSPSVAGALSCFVSLFSSVKIISKNRRAVNLGTPSRNVE